MTPTDNSDDRARATVGLGGSALSMLTREAARLPLFAITLGLQGFERARSMRELVVRRGTEVFQIAQLTPLGRFLPKPATADDGADDEATRIADDARDATEQASLTPIREIADRTAPAATSPAPAKPVVADEPPAAAVEAGAPGAVTAQVEEVVESLDVPEPETRDELPIPDFDNVSLGSLRARLRSLSVEQLVTLREWEQAHANRLPVMTLLDNRIAKISDDKTTPYPNEAGQDGAAAAKTAEARQAARDEGGTLRV